MIEFILARYNYWIVIALMMTGLYIVFSRGNLVKTLIGLNLFQTSVFIFYITMGKVFGGTAPILLGGHAEEGHGEEHGGDHAESTHGTAYGEHEDSYASDPLHEGGAVNTIEETHAELSPGESLHTAPEGAVNELARAETPAGDVAKAALDHGTEILYSNPLPHVLILTAIVVGVATTAVGLSLAVRIREAYGTVEEDRLEAIDNQDDRAEVLV
ncbi:sodium:proton antiporter [Parvularcula maris]|uniref:Cation:proton antiporter subunit C n=1 Tax=Parvularcula maris TaxID=2965077 RepID=A0A9X2LA97_9PROT|nr:cation:proton antiporter subunit C [Parvularcula maris]MCQ8186025.1 cation:proton antiporter subunit C [Parvularcula maris]